MSHKDTPLLTSLGYTEEETEAQLALEEFSLLEGVTKYRNEVAKAQARGTEADTLPAQTLMVRAMTPMIDSLKAFKADIFGGKAGRKGATALLLKDINDEEAAYLTAKAVMNGISAKRSLTQVALMAGTYVEENEYFKSFKAVAPKHYTRLKKKVEKVNTERSKRLAMAAHARKAGAERPGWEKATKITVGTVLVRLFCEATGLAEVVKERTSRTSTTFVIRPTETTVEFLNKSHQQCELMNPFRMPMVCKPLAWKDLRSGGYFTDVMTMLKTNSKAYLQELGQVDMPLVYDAMNTLQETPFRINRKVYNTILELWEGGSTVGGLPAREELPLQPLPVGEGMEKAERDAAIEQYKVEHPEAWAKWRAARKEVREENIRRISKATAMLQKLSMAERMAERDRIYFPHQMDWRGRIYSVVSFLSPQGDDTGKALLEFAEGKRIGTEGYRWLLIHTANCYGVDKVSFEDRIQWTKDHLMQIRLCAQDPFTYRFWEDADSPFQFLAACFDMNGAEEQGYDYVSHLPIGQDGSCNGLQHLSAMLRDAIGGKATNLIPSDKPSDIYAEVARVSQGIIAADTDPMAKVWAGKIDRKLVKRNVMTVAYGATAAGMLDQLRDELFKQHGQGLAQWLGVEQEQVWPAVMYLGGVVRSAIRQVVVAAADVMDWMQGVARVAASNDLPVRWTTPTGLVVQQSYRKKVSKMIDTVVGGIRVQQTLNEQSVELDTRRQVLGIAPNVTHSLDAAHLMHCVALAKRMGVVSFAMVHDSYGTHAADCDRMAEAIRVSFIEQYRPNVLQQFRDEVAAQLPEDKVADLPPVPTLGTLELDGIKDSQYFFA